MFLRQGVVPQDDQIIAVFADNGRPRNVYVRDPKLAADFLSLRGKTAQAAAVHQLAVQKASDDCAAASAAAEAEYKAKIDALAAARDAQILPFQEEFKAQDEAFAAERAALEEKAFLAAEAQLVAEARAASAPAAK